jgi:uncharacterized protein YyaL (SSP411 family)
MNALAGESSPFLSAHREHPVDWRPWDERAFAHARETDRPVFLLIGDASCRWCRSLLEECALEPDVRRHLAEVFVPVLVDREERPDVARVFEDAVPGLASPAGVPVGAFLTSTGRPFLASVYRSVRDGARGPGLLPALEVNGWLWTERRGELESRALAAARVLEARFGAPGAGSAGLPDPAVAHVAQDVLSSQMDPGHGGFGAPPKGMRPAALLFLLERCRSGAVSARDRLILTLDRMARGGLRDHLAGGFHEYAVDEEWRIPHFGKRLLDNAAAALVYADAAPLAPECDFGTVARETLDFMLADMAAPEGGLGAALESTLEEGDTAYYTWTGDELRDALDAEAHALLGAAYGFDGLPNYDHSRYVLHMPRPLGKLALGYGIPVRTLLDGLDLLKAPLRAARARRPKPRLDETVRADANGLAVAALARGAVRLGEPRFAEAAADLAAFVAERLIDPASGTLGHARSGGSVRGPALLADYACVVQGLLRLFEADGNDRWRSLAERLSAEQDARLWDDREDGYFDAGLDSVLLVRAKTASDGGALSGNGLAALNLLELGRLTGEPPHVERAERLLRAFGARLEERPQDHLTLLVAFEQLGGPGTVEPPRPAVERPDAVALQGFLELDDQPPGALCPFVVEITIRPGWHVHANPASLPFLIPLQVQGAETRVREVRYPEPTDTEERTGGERLSVYRGKVRVTGEIMRPEAGEARVRVTYQAGDGEKLEAPVMRRVELMPVAVTAAKGR